jgi:hypothetical protein
MIDFNDLRTRVDGLSQNGSSTLDFRAVFGKISRASQDIKLSNETAESDKSKLGIILNDFIVKIPNLPALKRMTADANDLAFALAMDTVSKCIERINARNKALTELTEKLDEQNDLAEKDAKLLTQIKEALDKATDTVVAVKTLISKISDDEADLKTKLLELLETLSDVSTIFKPQNV